MSLDGLRLRTELVTKLRTYLLSQGFEEFIPQLMTESVPDEPTIYPFETAWNGQPRRLATSPEAFLKQAMAAGAGNCFAVSPAFRNLEGAGRWHQPEFLMAEWYQRQTTYQDQMKFTQQLITRLVAGYRELPPTDWPHLSWVDLWQTYVQVDLLDFMDHSLYDLAARRGYTTENATWEQLFNQISYNEIEPHFPEGPFFLTDFPAAVSPLAKPQADSRLAERFELVIDRVELANGNTERFDEPTMRRIFNIEALRGLDGQSWAGVGLGIDRLAAFLSGQSVASIQTAI